jgi:hypothetical protein
MAEAPERFCSNCGHELKPEDQFCPNCGRPVHHTAHVPTPEADVPVPPAPQAGGTGPAAPQQAPPHPVRIALAVLLAGTIPLMIVYVVLVVGVSTLGVVATRLSPFRPAYLLLYFIVHVLAPLALGFWAGTAWPGKHTKGIGALAVLAGVTEAVAVWVVVTFHSSLFWWRYDLQPEDYIAPIATATLFMGGGLFADLAERWQFLRSERETMGAPQVEPIEAPPHSEEQRKMVLLLIQSLGPATLTLFGTIIAANITSRQ